MEGELDGLEVICVGVIEGEAELGLRVGDIEGEDVGQVGASVG